MKLAHYWPGALSAGEVHSWHLSANEHLQQLMKHVDGLSIEEKARSDRFKIEKDRVNYIVRHVFLRKVLACYLDIAWDQIEFNENDYGKPFIAGAVADDTDDSQSLQFSLSKSHHHVLLAITQNRLIGCDIERHNEALDFKAVIDNYFSAQEIKFILGSSNQRLKFFDYWATKEAYIKARGEGLSYPLDQFTLYIDKNDKVSMLENPVDPADVDKWHIKRLEISAGYSAAIATEGKTISVKQVAIKSI